MDEKSELTSQIKNAEYVACEHDFGPWLSDLNSEDYRICNRCGYVDDSRREPEQTI